MKGSYLKFELKHQKQIKNSQGLKVSSAMLLSSFFHFFFSFLSWYREREGGGERREVAQEKAFTNCVTSS